MSLYTNLGITVDYTAAKEFLRLIDNLEDRVPSQMALDKNGAATVIFEDENHFDEYSEDPDYMAIMEFLDGLDFEQYIYEQDTEGDMKVRGGYIFGFARVISYKVYGKPITDIDAVLSANGKKRTRYYGRGRR